ncbi:LPXTG cell wall anchor domain-containing protein [Enterococcus rotai]|uniref:LPXTG cell wall anchor domain-containing protein n=1 Tax=Enterococcus rotai TaxID=118060 RepID=UPI0035C76496
MKKKKICLLFLLLIGAFFVNNLTAVAAQPSGKTGGEIGFIDGNKEVTKEPEKQINQELSKKESSGLLPKTGEEFLRYFTIIGMILLMVTAIIFLLKRRNK